MMRPTWNSAASSSRSISRPISAEGGPACWAPGSQGPRVSSVARKPIAVALVEGLGHRRILHVSDFHRHIWREKSDTSETPVDGHMTP